MQILGRFHILNFERVIPYLNGEKIILSKKRMKNRMINYVFDVYYVTVPRD